MQIPRFRYKIFSLLIPEPEEKASELLRDLNANDNAIKSRFGEDHPALRASGKDEELSWFGHFSIRKTVHGRK